MRLRAKMSSMDMGQAVGNVCWRPVQSMTRQAFSRKWFLAGSKFFSECLMRICGTGKSNYRKQIRIHSSSSECTARILHYHSLLCKPSHTACQDAGKVLEHAGSCVRIAIHINCASIYHPATPHLAGFIVLCYYGTQTVSSITISFYSNSNGHVLWTPTAQIYIKIKSTPMQRVMRLLILPFRLICKFHHW